MLPHHEKRSRHHPRIPLALLLLFAASGCGTDEAAQKKGKGGPSEEDLVVESRTDYVREGDRLLQRSDSNGDGEADVFKQFLDFPDPDNPAVTKRRLEKLMIDVNYDGRVDVSREFNELGDLRVEKSDVNLDGTVDVVSYYDNGDLAKKELLRSGDKIEATRFYNESGQLLRVEKDTNDDGKTDYWEYYEQGVLDRIGRDYNADGAADGWQRR